MLPDNNIEQISEWMNSILDELCEIDSHMLTLEVEQAEHVMDFSGFSEAANTFKIEAVNVINQMGITWIPTVIMGMTRRANHAAMHAMHGEQLSDDWGTRIKSAVATLSAQGADTAILANLMDVALEMGGAHAEQVS